MKKKIIYSIATLSGTIIGVGIFSLPYITLKVGFWLILAYFLILGTLVILIHQFFGELALNTPDLKRLPGFTKIYLGKWGEKIAVLSSIFGGFGAILAYLIVGGEFLAELLSPILGGGNLIWTLIYFSFGAILIFFGIKAITKVEFWGLVGFFLILILIFLREKNLIHIENLFGGIWKMEIKNFLLPYGPILFSLWGAGLIPEIEEMLAEEKKSLKKVIAFSILIPIFVYLFFIYLVLGITGPQTTESALIGLKNFLGSGFFSLIIFYGVLTTFTSFIAIGLILKNTLWYDLKINQNTAWMITCFFPLFLFLIGFKNFISVISFVGGTMLAIEGILILLMYYKLKTKSQKLKFKFLFLFSLLFLILLGGIIYKIVYLGK